MERLTWQTSYSTGQEEIDLQHRYFITLINRLNEDMEKGGDREYTKHLLWELKKYADFHFQSEENLMYAAHVADLDSHKKMHDYLSAELAEKIQNSAWGANSPDKIVEFLVDWFVNHTLEVDVKSWNGQHAVVA